MEHDGESVETASVSANSHEIRPVDTEPALALLGEAGGY
jgi:hypothetical protein